MNVEVSSEQFVGSKIEPANFARVKELAAKYTLIPVRSKRIDDLETPVSAFLKVRAAFPGNPAFLLESAEQGMQMGRWSFIGIASGDPIEWRLGDPGDPYDIARQTVGLNDLAPLEDEPPFLGGAVGVFGYDLVRTVEPLGPPNTDPLGTPDLALMVADCLLAFDHLKHEHQVIALVKSDADDLELAYDQAVERIGKLEAALAAAPPRLSADVTSHSGQAVQWREGMSRQAFEQNVEKIIEYVYAGDAFQVVPSQRWETDWERDPFAVYRGLRVVNPSPYMYYLDFVSWQVAGASPEPLVTVKGKHITTRPIAGTRPRGKSASEDQAIAEDLISDQKERAEHVMLVDLSRNDLGRVCEFGTVQVDDLMVIETYSHLLHIVSAVSGTLRSDVDGLGALASVLPAGTLSGAPKFRAMQIIDEIEPIKRGGYGGAVGYLSWNGDLDTAIHIRTVVFKNGKAFVQAGGGTVADAKPQYEFEESVNKSRAVRQAVEVAMANPEWNICPPATEGKS